MQFELKGLSVPLAGGSVPLTGPSVPLPGGSVPLTGLFNCLIVSRGPGPFNCQGSRVSLRMPVVQMALQAEI